MNWKGRRFFNTNPYERRILRIVFISAGIPVFVVIGFFYCLFGDLAYQYLTANLADHFLYQFFMLSIIILAYYFLFVGIIAYRFVHRISGDIPRILSELDEKVAGKSRSHIYVRQGDYAQDMIDRINALIDQLPK